MLNVTREDGFTITELMVSMVVTLLITGAALQTFKNALAVNETAGQLADANQNLRAGTNTLVRDLLMAGRIIGGGGVPAPSGAGSGAINRPGPPGSSLTFPLLDDSDPSTATMVMSSITTGFGLGPTIHGSATDIVTIMTVDEFMPVVQMIASGTPAGLQGTVALDGSYVTLPTNSPWLVGDTTNDTQPIAVGDIVLFKNANGMALQTVTSKDSSKIYFAGNHDTNDWFNFNQRTVSFKGTLLCIKSSTSCDTGNASTTDPFDSQPSLFRALMITYFVDATTTPDAPRLVRQVNHYTPQALAGVVEDLDLTYDLVDAAGTVSNKQSLPYTSAAGVTYTANMIKKVNIHVGVRSESISKPTQDYVRNHISTAVDVRSLASVDRYNTAQ